MRGVVTALLILGACALLSFGGCAALIGWGIWEISNLPDYANQETVSAEFKDDIEKIEAALNGNVSLNYAHQKVKLSDAVLAIFAEINAREVDIYARHEASKNGHISSNGAGMATVSIDGNSEKCIIYIVDVDEIDYTICIRDHFADAVQEQ